MFFFALFLKNNLSQTSTFGHLRIFQQQVMKIAPPFVGASGKTKRGHKEKLFT
jgi:hypothetical protein